VVSMLSASIDSSCAAPYIHLLILLTQAIPKLRRNFPRYEPVIRDENENENEQTDTDQEHQTDTDRTEGEIQ